MADPVLDPLERELQSRLPFDIAPSAAVNTADDCSAFVDRTLGHWSSHPKWLAWRYALGMKGFLLSLAIGNLFIWTFPMSIPLYPFAVPIVFFILGVSFYLIAHNWMLRFFLNAPAYITTPMGREALPPPPPPRQEAPPNITGKEVPPGWLDQLRAQLGEFGDVENGTLYDFSSRQAGTGNTKSEIFKAWRFFLPKGFIPTKGQNEAFRQLDDIPGASPASPDIILSGPVGSGKTTVLMAAALKAIFGHGRRALIVVPTLQKAHWLELRMMDLVESCPLAPAFRHFIDVQILGPELAKSLMSMEKVPPHNLLIATLDGWESMLYCNESASTDSLRSFIASFNLVIIDDADSFPDAARIHLPFMTAKTRLFFETLGLHTQIVVATGSMTDNGLTRMLSTFSISRAQKLELLPTDTPRPICLDVRITELKNFSPIEISKRILALGGRTLFYRKDANNQEISRLAEDMSKFSQTPFDIVSDIDQLIAEPTHRDFIRSIDAVVFSMMIQSDPGGGLAAVISANDSSRTQSLVICRVLHKTDRFEPSVPAPVWIAPETSWMLTSAHLRSLARILPPGAPGRAESWESIGVRFSEDLRKADGIPDDARIHLLYDKGIAEKEGTGIECFPITAMEKAESEMPHPVDLNMVPTTALAAIIRIDDEGKLFGEDVEAGRWPVAEWVGENHRPGDPVRPIRREDITRTVEFKLKDAAVWIPKEIFGCDGRILIPRTFAKADGEEPTLPYFRCSWEIGAVKGLSQGGSIEKGFLSASLHQETALDCLITGLIDDGGSVWDNVRDVHFNYPAKPSAILFCRKFDVDRIKIGGLLTDLLLGRWGTDSPSFMPSVTAAFNYTFARRIPGLPYFARIMAFHVIGNETVPESILCWFLEPVNSGKAAETALHDCLDDEAARREVLESLRWFSQNLPASPADVRKFTLRYARIGYDQPGETTPGNERKLMNEIFLAPS